MSKIYKNHRRPGAPAEAEHRQAGGQTIGNQSMEALMTGAQAPSAENLGHQVDLPGAIREKMENAFGADLGGVRLYESQAVADAGAQAITMGNKIGFAPGQLDLASSGGQSLLGHELSHVVSQARGEVAGNGFLNDRALEARADQEGAMAAAGENVYSGPVTPLSASNVSSASGPMQAKKPWKKEEEKKHHHHGHGHGHHHHKRHHHHSHSSGSARPALSIGGETSVERPERPPLSIGGLTSAESPAAGVPDAPADEITQKAEPAMENRRRSEEERPLKQLPLEIAQPAPAGPAMGPDPSNAAPPAPVQQAPIRPVSSLFANRAQKAQNAGSGEQAQQEAEPTGEELYPGFNDLDSDVQQWLLEKHAKEQKEEEERLARMKRAAELRVRDWDNDDDWADYMERRDGD